MTAPRDDNVGTAVSRVCNFKAILISSVRVMSILVMLPSVTTFKFFRLKKKKIRRKYVMAGTETINRSGLFMSFAEFL